MEHILMIDDERFFARQYSRELEKSFRVTICSSVADGIKVFRSERDLGAMILDIQMPTPPDASDHETGSGVDTGVWFLRTFRNELVSSGMPIIILTNRREDDILNRIASIHIPARQIDVFRKVHTSPVDFLQRVTTILMKHRAMTMGS